MSDYKNNPIQLFVCLYAFFTGRSYEIRVDIENNQSLDILQFLSRALDLPTEFFEILQVKFANNISLYTQKIIKFFQKFQ